ncbi:MAG: hypothetical protein JWR50_3493 [Mucilaginibacter sp.]|nr:hypothetical protein [Mucilaginibacter sp.]
MKTAEKNAKAVQGTGAKGKEVRTENRPNITGKEVKKNETTENQKPAEVPQAEATQTAEVEAGNPATVAHQPANVAEQPKAEEVKTEEPKAEINYIKPVPNLEQTIKTVNDLHRRSIQRLALIARIKLLEDFEVKLMEENDELESNPYQGCKLIIKDDKNREFITNTPNLISMVSQFIFDACHEKLAEIEANIVFPNA